VSDRAPEVLVIGSGLVGASTAYELARAGCEVVVLERGDLASGTTAHGEGNILVSDKPPGAELDLALVSVARWHELADELDDPFEFDPKGGLAVATTPESEGPLRELAAAHGTVGVQAEVCDHRRLHELEPHLADDVALGVHYPQDAQVQPVLAAAAALNAARRLGATVRSRTEVTGFDLGDGDRIVRVRTTAGDLAPRWVVDAAGPWAGDVAALAGISLPVRPRRGHLLVTEPVGRLVHHKVYGADYVATLTADTDAAQVSPVVEGTPAGTILLGSSREFVGFDRSTSTELVRRIAREAVRLFPVLRDVALLRTYVGFRPWVPDHLPIVGVDPRVPNLVHATGHEGAGICLAPGTGLLVAAAVTGADPVVDPRPFAVDRLLEPAVGGAS
jgi:glycine/D-amino acid oxidase-like deaminating enzyme